MKRAFLILLMGISISCTSNNYKGDVASIHNINLKTTKPICSQYRVVVEIYDLVKGDTIKSNSWDPGWHGWDVGKPMPDSIIAKITIETTPYDFENNKPFDFILNANLQLKGSNTWDCMNPENPVLSEKKVIVNGEDICKDKFFNGENKAENLTKVKLSYVILLGDFLNEAENFYKEKGLMFILNALILTVELVEKDNTENKCMIEYYHPICLKSTETIFDFED